MHASLYEVLWYRLLGARIGRYAEVSTATYICPDLLTVGAAVLVLVVTRFVAMGSSIFLFARPARLHWKQAGLLTIGSLPMTEVGLGLVQTVSFLYPNLTTAIAPLLAGSLIVLELFGPVATQFALIKSALLSPLTSAATTAAGPLPTLGEEESTNPPVPLLVMIS